MSRVEHPHAYGLPVDDFELAQEAVFNAVEHAEMAVIDAVKDEVETLFHPLPKHHAQEVKEETVPTSAKGTQKPEKTAQIIHPHNMWNEVAYCFPLE